VYLPTRIITASKVARSRPPRASRSLLYHSHPVFAQTCSIMDSKFPPSQPSKCLFKLPRSRPQGASPNWLNYGLQVLTTTAFKMHLQTHFVTASRCIWNSHNYGLQVRTISAFKYISQFALSQPPSLSPT
jgi:hypothetical protein